MLLVSFPLAAWVISTIKDTTYTEEKTVYVDELKNGELDSSERVDEKEQGSATAWCSDFMIVYMNVITCFCPFHSFGTIGIYDVTGAATNI